MSRTLATEAARVGERRVPFAAVEIAPEAREAVSRVLASGWLTLGPEVAAFESEFAEMLGVSHAVAVSSCTAAIELSLRALGLPAGAPVLISTMTFCGAVHAIIHAGLRPVLVDVESRTLMPSADTTRDAARNGAAAMVVTHLAGNPAPIDALTSAAGLDLDVVIEDAAHALGAAVGTRPVGTISRASCFSFYATKNLPIGEGGMVTTTDQILADELRRTRLHGMSRDSWRRYLPGEGWRYDVESAGLKANMTDLQAAIGRAQLHHFAEWQRRRHAIVNRYRMNLSSVDGIELPPEAPGGTHANHLFIIRLTGDFPLTRDELIEALAARGVDCSVHFIPVHHHSYFRSLAGDAGFPVADEVFERIVSIPLYPSLRDADVDYICEQIREVSRVDATTGGDRR